VDFGTGSQLSFVAHLAGLSNAVPPLEVFSLALHCAANHRISSRRRAFRSSVKQPLEAGVSLEIRRYFQIRRTWEKREYVVPATADFEFLYEAGRRFHGE
jgi:hypothetical protein